VRPLPTYRMVVTRNRKRKGCSVSFHKMNNPFDAVIDSVKETTALTRWREGFVAALVVTTLQVKQHFTI
jgi:hypothetical protein